MPWPPHPALGAAPASARGAQLSLTDGGGPDPRPRTPQPSVLPTVPALPRACHVPPSSHPRSLRPQNWPFLHTSLGLSHHGLRPGQTGHPRSLTVRSSNGHCPRQQPQDQVHGKSDPDLRPRPKFSRSAQHAHHSDAKPVTRTATGAPRPHKRAEQPCVPTRSLPGGAACTAKVHGRRQAAHA